jgi:hypothetical protein
MKKKIKPEELTATIRFTKWQAFFRNPEKTSELKRAMNEKQFDENIIRNILDDDMFSQAAYVDDEDLIWDRYMNIRVNLSLPKNVILAEVGQLLDRYKKKYKFNTDKRLILSDANEVFQVWALYEQAGKQSSRRTFKDTARITGRKLSTVKDQWRKAFKWIYNQPYDAKSKYLTEKKKAIVEKELCLKCPNDYECYKKSDGEIFCSAYYKFIGREKEQKTTQYKDEMSSERVEEQWRNDEEYIDNISYKNSDD